LTTNRPYQQAHEPKEALRIIHSLAGKRLDPQAVGALTALFDRREIRVRRIVRTQASDPQTAVVAAPAVAVAPTPKLASASAAAAAAAPASVDPVVETTRT
jgi:hypothetical protein